MMAGIELKQNREYSASPTTYVSNMSDKWTTINAEEKPSALEPTCDLGSLLLLVHPVFLVVFVLLLEVVQVADVRLLHAHQTGQTLHVLVTGSQEEHGRNERSSQINHWFNDVHTSKFNNVGFDLTKFKFDSVNWNTVWHIFLFVKSTKLYNFINLDVPPSERQTWLWLALALISQNEKIGCGWTTFTSDYFLSFLLVD